MAARQDAPDCIKALHGASDPVPYAYRKALPRTLASAFDRVGPLLFRRKFLSVRPSSFRHIAVIRVDQIGDVVLAMPFLEALRVRYPDSRITLVTTTAGGALVQSVPGLCEVRIFDAPWFRGDRGTLQAMRELRALLQDLHPDAVLDLRGDVRHLWSARRALPGAWIEGYGITGGGFLADFTPPYRADVHAAIKNFAFADVPPPSLDGLRIRTDLAALPVNRRVRDLLPEKKIGRWIAFHIGAGADAKRWPEPHWKRLAERVSREMDAQILWIGDRDADDRARIILSLLDAKDRGRSTVICHLLGLDEVNTLLKRCDLLVTHDSGPAHIAAAAQVPTLVLFSGANRVEEWRPLSQRAMILNHGVPCAPCGLKTCDQPSHFCMEGIDPDRVFVQVKRLIQ